MATGTGGNDVLNGTSGADQIDGGAGDDKISGGAGADSLYGGAGNDQLDGGAGNDTLDGGAGSDRIIAGGGNDTAIWRYSDWTAGTVDYYDGGGNSDLLQLHFSQDVWLNNPAVRADILRFLQFMDTEAGPNSDGHLFSFQSFGLQVRNWETLEIYVGGEKIDPRAPYALDDSKTVDENGTVAVPSAGVLANDADLDTAALTVSAVNGQALAGAAKTVTFNCGSQLTINPDGSYSFNTAGKYDHLAVGKTATETVTYTVTDGSRTDTASLTITITGTNDGPVARVDSGSTGENQSVTVDVLANDTDVDQGAVLTLLSASAPAGHGAASVVDGKVVFNPGSDFDHLAAGATEQVQVSYTITDEHGTTSSSTVTITVTGTNDGPVANADTGAGHENQTLTLDVRANDTDVDDGAALTLVAASAPSGKGSASVQGNQLVFNPGTDFDHLAAGATEQVQVSYTITDEHNASSTSTVTITVTGTNDGPVANADTGAGHENQTLTINVRANDTDADDGAVLTLVSASAPAGKGFVSIDGNQLVFNPGTAFDHLAAGATEQVQVSYTIQDEHGATATSTVTITVTGTNDGPVANADTGAGHENQTLTLDVRANDTDVDQGAVLTLVSASAPAGQGTASVVDGKVAYNPGSDLDHLAEGVTQDVVVSYTIQDEHGATSSSTVTITVTGTNDGPVANADTGAGHENQTLTLDVLANDTDVDDGAVLTLVSASAPAGQGAATVVDGKVVFTPGTDFDDLAEGATEQVQVSYTITDEHNASSTSTVTITVTGTNDGPVANADTGAGHENQTLTLDVLANDTDVDQGAVLTLVSASAPAGQGAATVVDGKVVFTPGTDFDDLAEGATEQVVVSYTITDEHNASSTSTVTITVTGTNDGPVANADTGAGHENQTLTIDVLANDTDVDDGAALTLVAASAPSGKGFASVQGNQLVFNPGTDFDHLAAGATEQVQVSYTIQDEHGAQSSSTVTITVTGTNDGPVANADTAAGHENQTLTINVRANDTDADDGAVLTLVSASAPAGKGFVSIDGNQLVFNPGTAFDHLAAGATEQVQVSYTIQDEHGATATSTVTITVTGTNDGPVANADTGAGHENQTLTLDVRANDTDVDQGAVLTLVSASAPAGQGTASVVDGKVAYNPGSDFDHLAEGVTQDVVVSYTIQDEHGATSSSTVTITVTGTNDGPVIDAANTTASAQVTELGDGAVGENATTHTKTGAIAFSDVDLTDTHSVLGVVPQGGGYLGSLTLGAVDQAANTVGWSFAVADGALDGLAAGQVLTQTYTVTLGDGHGGTVAQEVTVTLTGTNDAPAINAAGTTASAQVTEIADGAAGENAATHTKAGAIAFSDVDLTDTHSVLGVVPQGSGYLGSLTLGAVDQAANTVGWSFAVADGALDGLAAGQVLTQTYTVTLSDGHGGTTTQDVAVTMTGANDAPVINAAGTTASAQVTEIADGAAGENAATHTKTGTIAFSDVDLTDTHSVLGVVPQGSGYLGSLTLGAVDQAANTVGWSFAVADGALDGLAAGQVVAQTYTVTVSDGKGGTATQDVTVTITGTNDAPVITSNGGGATASVTVSESSSAVTTVTATDLDSSSITYSIIGGDDAGKFTINSVTGALSFIAAPNYESPTDSDQNNSYVVQVRASDGAAADLQTITVNVSDVAEGDIQGPTGVKFNFNFASIDKLETGADLPGGVPLGSFVAVGDPNSTSFTYQIVDTDPSHIISNFFSLSATGALSTKASGVPSGTYTFDIVAVDQAGNASPATPITVWVGTTNDDGTGTAPVVLSAGTDLGFGLNGGDVINGGGGDDVILGGQNTDKIDGGSGNDLLLGGANTDTLLGNVGNDTILGSAGEDTINGGAGTDTLTGNGGDDVFVFQQGEAAGDRVTDFEGATAAKGDTLRFEGYGAGATLTYLSGDDWKITFSGGTEVIKLSGITALNSGDYMFV